MRIWLLCHQFLPEFYAGTETVTLQTALQLKQNGHDVTVIAGHPELVTTNENAVCVERYEYESLPVFRFRKSVQSASNETSENLSVYWNEKVASTLSELLDSEPLPDIVHVMHFAFIGATVLGTFKAKAVPIVFTATDFFAVCPVSHLRNIDGTHCNGPNPDHGNCLRHQLYNSLPPELVPRLDDFSDEDFGNMVWLAGSDLPLDITLHQNPGFAGQTWFRKMATDLVERKRLMSQTLEQIDLIVVPSTVVKESLVVNGANSEKMITLPFGLNKSKMTRNTERGKDADLKLAFIGQISEHKGLKVLVEAVKQLPAAALKLSIYGDMSVDKHYADSILALASGDDRIEFLGSFAPDQLGSVLSKHDVVVIPSLWSENTPLVLISSQANGCPAIVSREEGLCEIIKDRVNGLTFTTGDASELAEKISLLVNDRAMVEQLAGNTVDCLSIENQVAQLQENYERLVKRYVTAH